MDHLKILEKSPYLNKKFKNYAYDTCLKTETFDEFVDSFNIFLFHYYGLKIGKMKSSSMKKGIERSTYSSIVEQWAYFKFSFVELIELNTSLEYSYRNAYLKTLKKLLNYLTIKLDERKANQTKKRKTTKRKKI